MSRLNYYLKKPVESVVYCFCKNRVKAIAERYFHIFPMGLKNLPNESAILVANHEIGIDSGLLGTVIPGRLHYLVQNEGVYNSSRRMLLWAIGQIPVSIDKKSSNKIVVKRVGDYLNYSKDFVGIFGEGPTKDMSTNGQHVPISERKYQLGAAHFAISRNKKIVPVSLVTLDNIAKQFWNFPWEQKEKKFEELGEILRIGKEKYGKYWKIPYVVSIGMPIEGTDKEELTERTKNEIYKMYSYIQKRL